LQALSITGPTRNFDAVVAGLFYAGIAGQRGLKVLLRGHADKVAEKIRISSDGRCKVRNEFNAFLECGILAHGFLRLRCGDCRRDKLIAFSCKRRGFCPSCRARRMAAHGGPPGRSSQSACAAAPVGTVAADLAAPAAGRATQARDTRAAGRPPRHHALPA